MLSVKCAMAGCAAEAPLARDQGPTIHIHVGGGLLSGLPAGWTVLVYRSLPVDHEEREEARREATEKRQQEIQQIFKGLRGSDDLPIPAALQSFLDLMANQVGTSMGSYAEEYPDERGEISTAHICPACTRRRFRPHLGQPTPAGLPESTANTPG